MTITNLAAGANLSGEVEIDVRVATTNSIAVVNFFVDGEELDSVSAEYNGMAEWLSRYFCRG